MKRIYLDYAASTPVDPLVVKAMEPFWNEQFANPNATHKEGQDARKAVEEARTNIARLLGAENTEIVFTGSGTEANVLALRGTLAALRSEREPKNTHIITTTIEHASIRDCYRSLEIEGYRITEVSTDKEGVVNVKELVQALTEDTVFVSVMFANNEIGSVQPITEIHEHIQKFRKKKNSSFPYFHTDASQAPLFHKLDVDGLGVDMLTTDAQKLYGPKGVGALYVRTGTPIAPLCKSGNQEKGIRPGTANVPGIVGFARAYELAEERRADDVAHIQELRDYFKEKLEQDIPDIVVNGSIEHRLPNNLNISIPGLESEYVQTALDEAGIAAATRSACLSGGREGSYVVDALGTGQAHTAVRFTLGRETTKKDIDSAVKAVVDIASRR